MHALLRADVKKRSGEENLNSDLSDDERLGAVGEELVEEGHESAGEEADRPHSEGPDGLRGVVGGRHREAHLLHRRVLVFPLEEIRSPLASLSVNLQRGSSHCAIEQGVAAAEGGGESGSGAI